MFVKVEKILSDLVNIPSYGNIKEDHPIIQYLMTSFQSCCEIRKFFDEQGGTHLLIGVNTALDKVGDCILLSGHIDTVHPSTEHDAVAITQNDSIKGLGVSDMKCFWASIISNLEALKKISFPNTKLLLNFIEDYPMRVKVCNKGPHSNRKEEFCR